MTNGVFRATCPKCGKGLRVRPPMAGKKARCPGCGQLLLLPPDPEAASAQPSTVRHSHAKKNTDGNGKRPRRAALAASITGCVLLPVLCIVLLVHYGLVSGRRIEGVALDKSARGVSLIAVRRLPSVDYREYGRPTRRVTPKKGFVLLWVHARVTQVTTLELLAARLHAPGRLSIPVAGMAILTGRESQPEVSVMFRPVTAAPGLVGTLTEHASIGSADSKYEFKYSKDHDAPFQVRTPPVDFALLFAVPEAMKTFKLTGFWKDQPRTSK